MCLRGRRRLFGLLNSQKRQRGVVIQLEGVYFYSDKVALLQCFTAKLFQDRSAEYFLIISEIKLSNFGKVKVIIFSV